MPRYFDNSPDKPALRPRIRPSMILVEGQDDAIFFDHLLSDIQADDTKISIHPVGSKDNFKRFLPALLKAAARPKAFVIVRDADESLDTAIRDVNEIFNIMKLDTPIKGVLLNSGEFHYGYYLLPDNLTPGDLEFLCMTTVETNPIANKTIAFLDEIEKAHHQESLRHKSKRIVQSFLAASSSELCRGAGQGFAKGNFDRNSQKLDALKSFLNNFLNV